MTNVSPLRYQRHNVFCTPACANVNERRLTEEKKCRQEMVKVISLLCLVLVYGCCVYVFTV